MADCVATEHSWRLSENFDRYCKERNEINLEDQMNFSLDLGSEYSNENKDDCFNCVLHNKLGDAGIHTTKSQIGGG